jgi:hypothetical protein
MPRPNRIKTTDSIDISITDLTATAGGIIDAYTNPVNGFLQNVQWTAGNHTATGSLFITLSGTGESILTMTSGATTGRVNADFISYPRKVADSTLNVTLSGANGFNEFTEIPLNSTIHVVGSGMGNGKSGLGLVFTYV